MANEVNVTNPIHCNIPNLLDIIPSAHLQRALLAVAIACAILSLIPNLGTIGSLSTRSVAVMAASVQCIEAWKQEGTKGLMLQTMRLGSAVLGLAGVASNINALVIAALAIDMAFQTLESARGLYRKDLYKSVSHLTMILIDGFTIAGMLTNVWPYLVTAGAISALMMFVFASRAIQKGVSTQDLIHVYDVLSYAALGCVGIASAVRCSAITSRHYTRYYYSATDKSGQTMLFSFDAVDPSIESKLNYYEGLRPISGDYYLDMIQKPMTAQEFPILPIGGPSIVTKDPH